MTGMTQVEPGRDASGPSASSKSDRTQLSIDGMTCGNCARHVTQALQSVPGVRSATVSLDAHQATVRWQPEFVPNARAVIEAVQKEGFEAQVLGADAAGHEKHGAGGWAINLGVGVPVTALLMLGEWGFRLGMVRGFQWSSFALATVVQIIGGSRFYRGAWTQLKSGSSNMDTLVALGSSTAFAYSAWALLSGHGGHVYFMEAAAIITLISAGHWIEARASSRASAALRKLLNLAPQLALRVDGTGKESTVPVGSLRTGDRIALRPGDSVPVDGTVLEGSSTVDESMLTGEAIPVDKKTAAEIYAGTINLDGRLVATVTATGEATALAHIVAAVERAQSSRANIQRLGDRVSSVFVPLVVGVALVAGLGWALVPGTANVIHDWLQQFLWHAPVPQNAWEAAFIIAAAVLIIACPCAMGLATPAAIMASSNAAAERGILIRDGVALEKAGEVSAVLFDKTGTLTVGKPQVNRIAVIQPPGRGEANDKLPALSQQQVIKRLAAALACRSNHPISHAVADLADDAVELADWQEIKGAGVRARVKDRRGEWVEARLGAVSWLAQQGVDVQPASGLVAELGSHGATLVGLAREHDLLGLIALQDAVKPGAASVIAQLHRKGLKTFLITGDNSATAAGIAQQTGIPKEHVFSEVRPENKAMLVRQLQDKGERVAFVGDGINDAPALEQADLGIAVSRASDIAREAADIILLKSEIEAIPESLGLAQASLRVIKQNLFWAFFYNALGVPLAALGFMSPILCAAAMGLSDLVVIGNALRLRRWRLPG